MIRTAVMWDGQMYNKEFGTKTDWIRFLNPKKNNDKNINAFVDYMINAGILKETHKKNNKYCIYRPDEDSIKIIREMVERTEVMFYLEMVYTIIRNNKFDF